MQQGGRDLIGRPSTQIVSTQSTHFSVPVPPLTSSFTRHTSSDSNMRLILFQPPARDRLQFFAIHPLRLDITTSVSPIHPDRDLMSKNLDELLGLADRGGREERGLHRTLSLVSCFFRPKVRCLTAHLQINSISSVRKSVLNSTPLVDIPAVPVVERKRQAGNLHSVLESVTHAWSLKLPSFLSSMSVKDLSATSECSERGYLDWN